MMSVYPLTSHLDLRLARELLKFRPLKWGHHHWIIGVVSPTRKHPDMRHHKSSVPHLHPQENGSMSCPGTQERAKCAGAIVVDGQRNANDGCFKYLRIFIARWLRASTLNRIVSGMRSAYELPVNEYELKMGFEVKLNRRARRVSFGHYNRNGDCDDSSPPRPAPPPAPASSPDSMFEPLNVK
ncbi:hypothetical protein EVAR_55291_1 [Eumeta japonica]|uniref:Uncharacterized protein n=1 Tax=Eumeta variegata TaxID=151549 RepID=A0A4C1ZK48_EUMVA|nr:hypothetical protein EVAR_55291_1 [Eumeta japonica]